MTFLPLNVHANDNSLATIFSFKYEKQIPGVFATMDKSIDKSMNVIMKDGKHFKSRNVDWGYIIMIWQALMYWIVIKLTQKSHPTTSYQLELIINNFIQALILKECK